MKSYDKEIEKVFINDEKKVLEDLKTNYKKAVKDVKAKIKKLDEDIKKLIANDEENESLIRSKVYQLEYQKALKEQLDDYIEVLGNENLSTIDEYLEKMYTDSYLTTMYRLNKQGIPITTPISQELLIDTISFSFDDMPLSKRLYSDLDKTKKTIINEIARGFSTGQGYGEIARNVENVLGVSMRKANQLAQNEGQRVRLKSAYHSMTKAKEKGADIVKVWTATLDGKTRPAHGELDRKWAELDDYFISKYHGKVFAPKEFGIASEDINCRCALSSLPRWEVDNRVSKEERWDNENKEFVEVENYEEWKRLYYNVGDGLSEPKTNKYNFKTSETIESAIDYAKTLGIEALYNKDFHISVANEINKCISNFYNDFGNLNEMGVLDEITKLPTNVNAYACYSYGSKCVGFKNVKFKNALEKMSQQATEQFDLGFWSSGDTMHAVNHELGHAIDAYLQNTDLRKYSKINVLYRQKYNELFGSSEWRTIPNNLVTYDDLKERYKKAKENGLSYYGFKNEKEFIAECVSGYYGGNDSDIIKQVISIIKE